MKLYLGESEDVVDEEQHVLTLLVTEVLGDGETGQGDTGTGARGLVHLAVDKGDLEAMVDEGWSKEDSSVKEMNKEFTQFDLIPQTITNDGTCA